MIWRALKYSSACLILTAAAAPETVQAQSTQQWHRATEDSLVLRAIARRGEQLADSTLLSYQANAHGFLAFLAQLGEGTVIPPRVVQSEELMSRLYWWQPDRSVQQLVGRRDTTLLPAAVGYYRDRYRVVLDNLPDRIRLGDGQDVRDVPHPLSPAASAQYEYVRGRKLTIALPDREINVDEIQFRPIDADSPGAIGSVYLDRESGAVVRLSMAFTRAAIIDRRIETLVVTIENMLVNTRYWLPSRQEVEVSRRATWFELPVRGIVRGRWEISGYSVNERVADDAVRLPQWSSVSADSLRAFPFENRIVDVLPPGIRMASAEELVAARGQIEAAVRASALARPQRTAIAGSGISDLLRFNRTEGLAAGLGVARRFGEVRGSLNVGYGVSDREFKGRAALALVTGLGGETRGSVFAERSYRNVVEAERAGVTNSVFALAFGSDYTTQVDVRAAGVEVRKGLTPWRLRVAWEDERSLASNAKPLSGTFTPTLAAWHLSGVRGEVTGSGGWYPAEQGKFRGEWRVKAEAGLQHGNDGTGAEVRPLSMRLHGALDLNRSMAGDRALFLRSWGAVAAGNDLPPQWFVHAGGPWSAPGYEYASIAGKAFVSQRAEFRFPVPAPSLPLGKYGRSPAHMTLAPFAQLLVAGGTRGDSVTSGVYPSVGTGVLFFYDMIRFDVSRGLRNGYWQFSVDIDRGFWGLL